MDRTKANVAWNIAEEDGTVPSWERASIAVLMDIRRELQALNRLLACPEFTGIPLTLKTIAANTRKPRTRRRREHA